MNTIQETLQNKALTGELKKPNPNNPVTRERMKLKRMIAQAAEKNEIPESEVAIHFARQGEGDLKRYIIQAGEIPAGDLVGMCLQAELIRKKEIEKIAQATGYEIPDAEIFLEQMEADGVAENPDADNFLGAIAAAVKGVAARAANKIVEKRQAKGKGTKFWGSVAGQLNEPQSIFAPAEQQGGFGVFASDVLQGIKDAERRKEINKMLPGIIAAVILIIVITYLFTKNAKN